MILEIATSPECDSQITVSSGHLTEKQFGLWFMGCMVQEAQTIKSLFVVDKLICVVTLGQPQLY